MSLPENPERIKLPRAPFWENDRLFTAALLVAVALASFGLGRWSGGGTAEPAPARAALPERGAQAAQVPAAVTPTPEPPPVAPDAAAPAAGGMYVGSKNSNKYHLPWCAGARSISEANKVWFSSKEEAAAAGYVPASNCKGI